MPLSPEAQRKNDLIDQIMRLEPFTTLISTPDGVYVERRVKVEQQDVYRIRQELDKIDPAHYRITAVRFAEKSVLISTIPADAPEVETHTASAKGK